MEDGRRLELYRVVIVPHDVEMMLLLLVILGDAKPKRFFLQ
jgi:hypothetical protein